MRSIIGVRFLVQGFYAVLGFFQFFGYIQCFGGCICNAAANLQEFKPRNAVLHFFDNTLQTRTAKLRSQHRGDRQCAVILNLRLQDICVCQRIYACRSCACCAKAAGIGRILRLEIFSERLLKAFVPGIAVIHRRIVILRHCQQSESALQKRIIISQYRECTGIYGIIEAGQSRLIPACFHQNTRYRIKWHDQ